MRPRWLVLLVLVVLVSLATTAHAWSQSDFEIFDLVDELETSEGKDVNFYSWLNVKPTATIPDINRAYRKMSLKLHPDKNKEDPKARERFARLGKIVGILRNDRERYDFFYKNGVPRWRGTGYYYSRFRPGLGFVTLFLILVSGGMEYLAGVINYRQEKSRIQRLLEDARANLLNKGATRGRTYIEVNGRAFRAELKQQDTLLVHMDDSGDDVVHVTPDSVQPPSLSRNVFWIRIPLRLLGKEPAPYQPKKYDGEDSTEDDASQSQDTKSSKKGKKKPVKKPTVVENVGGRRRPVRG